MTVFNKLVHIQKLDQETEEWNDYFITHANVNKSSGKEYFNANTNISSSTFNFSIRYSPYLRELMFNTDEYRLIYDDKYFDIKNVDNFMLKNNELIIVGEFNGKYLD